MKILGDQVVKIASVGTLFAALLAGLYHSGISAGQIHMDQQEVAVWEKALLAKGGRDRLSRVRNVFRSCRAVERFPRRGYRGLGARHDVLFVLPDKYWLWNDDRPSPFGLEVTAHSGEAGKTWTVTSSDSARPQESATTEADRYALIQFQLIYLLDTAWIRPVPSLLRHGSVRGRQVDVLDVVWQSFRCEYSLDSSTHLPLKVSIFRRPNDGPEQALTTIPLGRYVPSDGIQMPETIGAFDTEDTSSRIRCATEINVEYDGAIFNRPPRIEDGPDAWRPHRKP